MKTGDQRQPNLFLRQQRLLRGWSLQRVVDEICALSANDGRIPGINAAMVCCWEMGKKKPSPFYQERLCKIYDMSADQLGLIDEVYLPISSSQYVTIQEEMDKQSSVVAYTLAQETELQEMDTSRRDFLQTIGVASATFALAPHELANYPLWEQLSKALAKGKYLDENALRHLEMVTKSYGQLRLSVAAPDLLYSLIGHLRTITQLLNGALLPTQRIHLSSIASETALLTGIVFYDMGYYNTARSYFTVARSAAQEADNFDLQAHTLGHEKMPTGTAEEAIPRLEKAIEYAEINAVPTLCAWLAAQKAEAHADLQDAASCLQTLEKVQYFVEQIHPEDDPYATGFDSTTLHGYKGVCYMRLNQFEEARASLQTSLADTSPIFTRSTFIDIAATYLQQKESGEACRYAIQALHIIDQTKSKRSLHRIIKLRQELEPWKTTQSVRELDDYTLQLVKSDSFKPSLVQ